MTEEQDQELNRIKREIGFGIDVEQFLKGDIGVYLCEKAEAERKDTLEALATVTPTDEDAIRTLQQRIAVLDSWQGWLAEAVNAGRAAQDQLVQALG